MFRILLSLSSICIPQCSGKSFQVIFVLHEITIKNNPKRCSLRRRLFHDTWVINVIPEWSSFVNVRICSLRVWDDGSLCEFDFELFKIFGRSSVMQFMHILRSLYTNILSNCAQFFEVLSQICGLPQPFHVSPPNFSRMYHRYKTLILRMRCTKHVKIT